MTIRPAWSEAFDPARLQPVRALPLPSRINAEWAWGGSSGAGVTVAIVDSGIESGHPRVGTVDGGFASLIYDPRSDSGIAIDTSPHDDLVGHGTACAAAVRTIAPECALMSVRVLTEKLTGRGEVFAAGLRYAIASGAQIVNCSLSSSRADYKELFQDIADEAYFAGVILVCAVNNVPNPSFPSTFASVISVAAHDGNDPFAYDANPRPPVDFGAPGIDREVAWRGGAVVKATGNSFAAPHIAGHIARLLSKHPGLTPYEVKTVLRACAQNAAP